MEFSGKTVEIATEAALTALKITREQAEITVLEEKGGLFKKARVEVTKKLSDNEKALDFVEKLFDKMGIAAAVELVETEEEGLLNVTTTETSEVIGKRGETLDAIQYITCMFVNKDREDFHRVVIDCENYREKRAENLKGIANKLAEKAIETGRRVQLDPMNPYERRIIHAELQKNDKVTTESRGTDPNRYVVIYPKDRKFPPRTGKPFNKDRNQTGRPFNRDAKPFNRDNRDGSRDSRDNRGGARGGFNRDRKDQRPPQKKSFGFGTYLGNVNDNKTEKKEEE